MSPDDVQPNGGTGAHAERLAHRTAALFDCRARRRLLARAFFVVLLFGSVGSGVLVDFGLHALGLAWPPVFTGLWGIGALLAVGAGWTRFELRSAAERDARRREDD